MSPPEVVITDGPSFVIKPAPGAVVAPLPRGRLTLTPLVMSWTYPDGTTIEATVHVTNGRARARRIVIESDTELPMSTLRHHPLRDYIADGIQGYLWEPPPGAETLDLVPVFTTPSGGRIVFPHLPASSSGAVARRATRERVTPQRLEQVADLYRRGGARLVASELGYDLRHARRLVQRARPIIDQQEAQPS